MRGQVYSGRAKGIRVAARSGVSKWLRRHWTLVLLVSIPVAALLEFLAPERQTAIFVATTVAIVPLAAYIGRATDDLANRLGGGIGGLLNATFGNAAELIIGALALRRGLTDLVKASLTGSIIGNVLLVFGLCAIVGGVKRSVLKFNRTAAGMAATMLVLSAIGLTVPAVFHQLSRGRPDAPELTLDTEIAVVLFLTYCASLLFMLKTHRGLYDGRKEDGPPAGGGSAWPSVALLISATAGVAWMSELLVGSVAEAAPSLGMSNLFVGVVVVAIIGNAAEHFSAVLMAARNQMDAAIGIAVGSSTQIALFVAPVLVFLSYAIAPRPMDLRFTVFEVVAVGLAVITISLIAQDGETHWMEGVQLLAVYIILVLGFYFMAVPATT
jgi:Ca2+:H+ antiporter